MNSTTINFFSKLKDQQSSSIYKELYNFVNSEKLVQGEVSNISIIIQDFIYKLSLDFAKLWEIDFNESSDYYTEIVDGFESLIMKSLYGKIMKGLPNDNKFDYNLKKFSFITYKHLNIDQDNIDEFELVTQLKSKYSF
jgi:hypothetical protein